MCTFAIPNRRGKSKARGGAEDEERIERGAKRKVIFFLQIQKSFLPLQSQIGDNKTLKAQGLRQTE
ncbi:hypothetical protein ADIARSV_0772 [Arcticibacter svalbardensis MN12-7]|uniref:Uncharacterized protein n=1 Tax=Arcticibacter svalbardensis MN12-7 TaxID=1150600 RepID=R9H4D6_9SPHI|nr:hypothetical protein ADIARSV_0772 [Arcticibacter svalbardensis MN12-7]